MVRNMVKIPELKRGIANNVTELIGNTPLVRLNRITEGTDAEVVAKLESFNPLSSVKDRIGVAMIEYGEEQGLINKDSVLSRTYKWKYRYCTCICCSS